MTQSISGQPTPAQWWEELDEADRLAYMAASKRAAVGLTRAGTAGAATGLDGHPWEHALPSPYLEYARARAAELDPAGGRLVHSRQTRSGERAVPISQPQPTRRRRRPP